MKINSIDIAHFRGINDSIIVNFSKSAPHSTIIVGDNGSGKSSIIDALEFGIQGKIHNTSSLKAKSKVEILNQFSEDLPKVKIIFQDTTEIIREVTKKEDDSLTHDQKAHSDFKIAPFILRRSNILQFWNTPDTQRQVLFFNYNLGNKSSKQLGDSFLSRIGELENERLKIKRERREYVDFISKYKKIDPNRIPLAKISFINWATDSLLKKKSIKEIEEINRTRKRNIVEPKVVDAIKNIMKYNNEIARIDNEIKKYKPKSNNTNKTILNNIFKELSLNITKTFLDLSTVSNDIKEIEFIVGETSEVSLNFNIVLNNRNTITPERFLSEANLDLLAFVIFYEMTKKAVDFGQSPVLVLDDVFQSVDSGIRLKILNYILSDLNNWQLIITIHDRLWKEQLIELFRIKSIPLNIIEITNWCSKNGINIFSDSLDLVNTLKNNICTGSINEIISNSSILLEQICNKLSIQLPISVTRRKNDKYTLGDLWPGIFKSLKKTNIQKIVESVNDLIYLRNLIGGHYNEWALSLTRKEAEDFGNIILDLHDNVVCKKCGFWIDQVLIGTKKVGHSCRCKEIEILKV